MSTVARSISAMLVLLVSVALVTVLGPDAGATTGPAARSVASRGLALGADTVAPAASSRRAAYAWSGRRIAYYSTLPAAWAWSLSTAVAKWNGAGGSIRFVRTADPGRAKLRIGYGRIGAAAGRATVGRTAHAWVRLSSRYSTVSALDAYNRVEVMAVLAHELGHVLGFEHTSTPCSLMAPVLDVSGCNTVAADRPGYYRCRTIDPSLETRFIRLYGGRTRFPSSPWCLIDPLPSVLPGVTVGTDSSSLVTVGWGRPAYEPAGSQVLIRHWAAGSCDVAPDWAATVHAPVAPQQWQDIEPADGNDNCFRVQLVNRYDAGRTPTQRIVDRAQAAPSTQPAS